MTVTDDTGCNTIGKGGTAVFAYYNVANNANNRYYDTSGAHTSSDQIRLTDFSH